MKADFGDVSGEKAFFIATKLGILGDDAVIELSNREFSELRATDRHQNALNIALMDQPTLYGFPVKVKN